MAVGRGRIVVVQYAVALLTTCTERCDGDGVHVADTSDLMRRLVKERLLKFDGTPLFPERIAYTVNYKLSDADTNLEVETFVLNS